VCLINSFCYAEREFKERVIARLEAMEQHLVSVPQQYVAPQIVDSSTMMDADEALVCKILYNIILSEIATAGRELKDEINYKVGYAKV